jgi:O-antigen ligase
MREAFIHITNFIFLLVACVYPFIAVLRGHRYSRAIGTAWAASLIYMILLCLALPMAVSFFVRGQNSEIFKWVPEGPNVVGVAFMGWVVPGVAALTAFPVRWLLRKFCPKAFVRIQDLTHTSQAQR